MTQMTKAAEVSLILSGKVVTSPELVSRYGGTKVLSVEIENRRRSGIIDRFGVHFANTIGVVLQEGQYIEVHGDIRSVNSKDTNKAVYPFVMASSIKVLPEEPAEYRNDVEIYGAELVDFGEVRPSFADKDKPLATYHIRVMRKHGRYGLFRVTTWGRDAVFLGNIHKSVTFLDLKCRLQSFYGGNGSSKLRFGLVTYYVEVPDKDEDSGGNKVTPKPTSDDSGSSDNDGSAPNGNMSDSTLDSKSKGAVQDAIEGACKVAKEAVNPETEGETRDAQTENGSDERPIIEDEVTPVEVKGAAEPEKPVEIGQ